MSLTTSSARYQNSSRPSPKGGLGKPGEYQGMSKMLHLMLSFLVSFGWVAFAQKNHSWVESQGGSSRAVPVLVCLSAHPDDEDGATLAYYSKLKGVKTYSIFFTRGEGGQNETGPELYDELGILRTEETLKAAALLGTEAYFLGFPDFGFSKTERETFAKWGGKESVTAKLVYFIRMLQPDVIITNHDTVTTKPRRQHGNHQAVGISAYEAFQKAADPSFHPEQLTGNIRPWQSAKLFFRSFASQTDTSRSLVTIEIDMPSAAGKTVEEIALSALAQHRSQGMERILKLRKPRYALIRSDSAYPSDPNDLFSGLTPRTKLAVHTENGTAGIQPISIMLSPECVPVGETAAIKLTLINRTGKKCITSISAALDSAELIRKSYDLSAYSTSDTLGIGLIKNRPGRLIFKSSTLIGSREYTGTTYVRIKRVKALYDHLTNVGLVKTYDNTLEETLLSFGVKYRLLDSNYLAAGDLGKFNVILLDMRTFLYRSDAVKYSRRLTEYAEKGGNVVCFYNKPEEWNDRGFSPYPIFLTNERVTEEEAAVNILEPGHPLFNRPNRITGDDWNGWLQERSLYLPADDTVQTSAKFERLLSMSDEGEHQPPTSLLWSRHGKGSYSYVSLALYRQLRILEEGAVKLFFNLISQAKY